MSKGEANNNLPNNENPNIYVNVNDITNQNVNTNELPTYQDALNTSQVLQQQPQTQPQVQPVQIYPSVSMTSQQQPVYAQQPQQPNQYLDPKTAPLLPQQQQPVMVVPNGQNVVYNYAYQPNGYQPNISIPRSPMTTTCPFCKKTVTTFVKYEENALVWILALVLCFITCIFFFIPFCIDDIKDAVHYCPTCRREIARNEKMK